MKRADNGWAFPDADQFMVDEQQADGTYQASHLAAALKYVTDFRLAIDGGAHVGTWSKLMAACFEKVLAIEPAGDTYEALVENLATFSCLNVEAKNVALGATAGSVRLDLDAANRLRKNTGGRFVQPDGPIALVAIDALELPALGFLKLDIEGSEYAALLGARQTLLEYQPIVLFENKKLWRRYGVENEGPQQVLTSVGYRQLEQSGCDVIWGPA